MGGKACQTLVTLPTPDLSEQCGHRHIQGRAPWITAGYPTEIPLTEPTPITNLVCTHVYSQAVIAGIAPSFSDQAVLLGLGTHRSLSVRT